MSSNSMAEMGTGTDWVPAVLVVVSCVGARARAAGWVGAWVGLCVCVSLSLSLSLFFMVPSVARNALPQKWRCPGSRRL